MLCMRFARLKKLKKDGKGKGIKAEKKGCHIRTDRMMQIAQKSLPVLAAEVLK